MHHLHPRSRSTSTLFTTTLAVSFLVVAAPHLLPCPVDRRQFADSAAVDDNGQPIKRRRRKAPALDGENNANVKEATDAMIIDDGRPKRECPVPKPPGLLGQIMGFKETQKKVPAEVIVQDLRSRVKRDNGSSKEAP